MNQHSFKGQRPKAKDQRSDAGRPDSITKSMQEVTRKRPIRVGVRARAPLVARAAAILILTAAVAFIAISYYRLRNNKPFRMRSETPELSKEVTGRTEGYEQRVTRRDGSLQLLLKACRWTLLTPMAITSSRRSVSRSILPVATSQIRFPRTVRSMIKQTQS